MKKSLVFFLCLTCVLSLCLPMFATNIVVLADEEPADTQELNLRVVEFGNNYDVQDMGWRWMMADCYEGLMRNVADEKGEQFVLAGAESYDVSDDGLVYTFHLRKDAKWSDGVPVTAHDYEYGWKRLLDPQYGYDYASFIFNVVGAKEYWSGEGKVEDVMAKALDDYTFEVTLKIPDPTLLAKLVATPLYPTRQDIAEAAGENWGKDWKLCVYNGPFCMSELIEDNKMVWTRNEEYWNKDATKLDAVNWYVIPEDATAAIMFDNGDLDVLQTSGDYSIKYNKEAEDGTIQVIQTPYPGSMGVYFNRAEGGENSGLMGNLKIRKAIGYCLDREEMIEGVYGHYLPAYGLVPPAISFKGESYRNLVEEPMKAEYEEYVNSPEKLQELFKEGLKELGKEDLPLSDITLTMLSYGNSTENNNEREYCQQIIESKLGVKVDLNITGDYALFTAQRDAGNWDFTISGWYSDYNDPLDFLYTMYTDIYPFFGRYSNKDYDALIDKLEGLNDLDERLKIYEEAEKLVIDDAGVLPVWYATKEYFVQNWVKDFNTSSFGASQELYVTYIEGRGK